jgi:hypothetical protein
MAPAFHEEVRAAPWGSLARRPLPSQASSQLARPNGIAIPRAQLTSDKNRSWTRMSVVTEAVRWGIPTGEISGTSRWRTIEFEGEKACPPRPSLACSMG